MVNSQSPPPIHPSAPIFFYFLNVESIKFPKQICCTFIYLSTKNSIHFFPFLRNIFYPFLNSSKMAAIPSAINLIENHLSAENEAKSPYQIYKPLKGNNDKDLLLVGEAELQRGLTENERNIRTQFTSWPFQAMKFTNWFILFVLAIGTKFCASRQLYWSQFWKTIFHERPYNLAWEFSAGQWILFSLASISIFASLMAKSGRIGLFIVSLFTLMDLCIYAFSIPILIILNTIFSLTALAEYRFYLPKLAHFDGTQEELLALTEIRRPNGDFDYFDVAQLHFYWRERRPIILFHLLADPLISFFAILAILLNIGLLICIAKMMRRVAIWKRANCEHPNCSQFQREYSAHYPFGMIKTLQWLLPLFVLFSFLYIPLFNLNYFNNHFAFGLGFISLICFGQWLFYFCKVHLLEGDHRLGPIFFIDWIISTSATLFFVISYSQQYTISQYQLAVYVLLFSLNFASICLLCRLLWRNPTICSNLELNLPNISIQVQFNVNVVKNVDGECSTKRPGAN